MRLFVAITPGAEVAAGLSRAASELRATAPGAKWIKGEAVHVTLAFLGERDPAEVPAITGALEAAAVGHAPFVLRASGGGAFGRPGRPRVLWVGCEGDLGALRALHADVVRALEPLGYAPDRDTLTPHLTLARSREAGGDRALARCAEALSGRDLGEVRVEAIELYESRLAPSGAIYTVAGRAPLGARAGRAIRPSPS